MKTTLSAPRWTRVFPNSFGLVPREINELFQSALGSEPRPLQDRYAPVNVWEDEGKFHVELELPGVKSDELEITFEENTLRVKAETKSEKNEADEKRKYWHRERTYGSIERIVSLPEGVDPENVEAELHDGILTVTVAKRPETQPRKVTVKAK